MSAKQNSGSSLVPVTLTSPKLSFLNIETSFMLYLFLIFVVNQTPGNDFSRAQNLLCGCWPLADSV